MKRLFAGALMSLAVVAVSGAAQAGDYADGHRAKRKYVHEAPVKDCTKFNGRWGYYGNPWCTPEEQARFDRWQARNLYR